MMMTSKDVSAMAAPVQLKQSFRRERGD
jgi:hypothetical protein